MEIKGLKKQEKYAFMAAVISMFVTHYYFFANRMICYEDLVNSFVPRDIYSIGALDHGRWFLPAAQIFSSNWSMPQVSGLISGVVFGLTAILLIRIFEIKSVLLSTLLGMILTTFPAVACYNAYTHQAETFVIALCLATVAVYLTGRYKHGFIAGGIVLCFSLGIYQVFVSYAIALVYVLVLIGCLKEKTDLKSFFGRILPYVVMMGIAAVLYVVTTKSLLAITGVKMVSYHNADKALTLSNINIAIGIKPMIIVFLQYFFSTIYNGSVLLVGLNIVAALMIGYIVINRLAVKIKEKNWMNMALILLLLVAMPFGINSLPVVLGNAALNGNGLRRYMFYCLIVTYILFIVIVDHYYMNRDFVEKDAFAGRIQKKKLATAAGVIILCGAIWGGYLQCNQAYTRANTVYESVYGYMNRILARAEQIEGWDRTVPVYFANNCAVFSSFYEEDIEEFDALFDMEPLQLQKMYDQKTLVNFWRIYLHMQVESPTEEQIARIEDNPAYEEMGAYPAADSMQLIDGVLVIKLNEH